MKSKLGAVVLASSIFFGCSYFVQPKAYQDPQLSSQLSTEQTEQAAKKVSDFKEILTKIDECAGGKTMNEYGHHSDPIPILISINILGDNPILDYELKCEKLVGCISENCEADIDGSPICKCDNLGYNTVVYINTKFIKNVNLQNSNLRTPRSDEPTTVFINQIPFGTASYHLPYKDAETLEQLLEPFFTRNK